MKTLAIVSLSLAFASVALPQESPPDSTIHRENIEWCDIWIPSAAKTDKPRVLLAGDSITRAYYQPVCRVLGDQACCAQFATSACIADPAFHAQLESILSQYTFAVIHLNNGLHGDGYSEQQYRAGFEKALKTIQKKCPSAKLVLALSTPVKETEGTTSKNQRIVARNAMVQELAKTYHAMVDDLHAVSKGHPEYYADDYHYKPEAIELQAKQVARMVKELL